MRVTLCSLLVAALCCAPAMASEAQLGTISKVSAASNGAFLFNTDGARSLPPACQASAAGTRYVVDASSAAGQAQLQLLLEALRQGRRVFVHGRGICSIIGDIETIDLIDLES